MNDNKELAQAASALKANRFNVEVVEKPETVKDRVLATIPPASVVGIGDSVTVRQLGVIQALKDRGTSVYNPFTPELLTGSAPHEQVKQRLRESFGRDFYITGTNAITLDGKLVNIDRVGNRVAGMIYGAPNVILIMGQNKIVKNVDEAIYRIKNVITPAMLKRRGRNTPCARTGKCSDCNTIERACNILTIMEKKPLHTDLTIFLVAADLGLGWDPSWPPERIQNILDSYYAASWTYTLKLN